jgi:hypothetical protein
MNWFFDECLPPKWFRIFAEMLLKRRKQILAAHLLDHLQRGTKDDAVIAWISAQPPPVMMVSGDTGRNTKFGDPRMDVLCPQHNVTSVFMSPKLCQEEGFEKFRMMICCLPELEDAYAGPTGTRYRLERSGRTYTVKPWPIQTRP